MFVIIYTLHVGGSRGSREVFGRLAERRYGLCKHDVRLDAVSSYS